MSNKVFGYEVIANINIFSQMNVFLATAHLNNMEDEIYNWSHLFGDI